MKAFIKEAARRFRSDVPPFFRKIQFLGGSLATFGTALQALALPPKLLGIAGYIAISGGVMVAVSQFVEKQISQESGVKNG